MSAGETPPDSSAEARAAVKEVSSVWWVVLVVGLIFVGFGVVMLFDVAAGATAIAIIVGAFLIFDGVVEVVTGGRTGGSRAIAVVLGLILIAGGVIAIVWPGVTFLVIAVVWGITIVVGGLARIVGSLTIRGSDWGWTLVFGIAELIVGILALAWPHITAHVILLLIGIYAILAGILQIVLAVALRNAPKRLGIT